MDLTAGKKLKYGNSDKISTISKIDGDTVYFTDNSRASVNVVEQNYSELSMNDIINENAKSVSSTPTPTTSNISNQINNMASQPPAQGTVQQAPPTQTPQNQDPILAQLAAIQSGQAVTPPPLVQDEGNMYHNNQVVGGNGQVNANDYSQLSPETQRQVQESIQRQQQQQHLNEQVVANDPFYNQFNEGGVSAPIPTNPNLQPVNTVTAEDNKKHLELVQQLNSGEITQEEFDIEMKFINGGVTPVPVAVGGAVGTQAPRYQHNPKLPKMRKTKAIKLSLVLNERIPKLEDIRAVDSLFDDISLVEELGKEIAAKYLSDPELLEDMIISELEKQVKATKRRSSTRKKTTAKKTTAKKTIAKPAAKKEETPEEKTEEEND